MTPHGVLGQRLFRGIAPETRRSVDMKTFQKSLGVVASSLSETLWSMSSRDGMFVSHLRIPMRVLNCLCGLVSRKRDRDLTYGNFVVSYRAVLCNVSKHRASLRSEKPRGISVAERVAVVFRIRVCVSPPCIT